MHRAKPALLLKKMKTSPDISWNEKGELKYKGGTVRGSNVVDLVNDVLRKRKYFNPQGWEAFGEALRDFVLRSLLWWWQWTGFGSVIVLYVPVSKKSLIVKFQVLVGGDVFSIQHFFHLSVQPIHDLDPLFNGWFGSLLEVVGVDQMYSPHWNSLEIKGATRDAMGANKYPRKPPLCKTVFFFWRLMDFLARVLKPALFLLSLVFCAWVNCTFPLKMLSAHSRKHSTKLRSALEMICLLMHGQIQIDKSHLPWRETNGLFGGIKQEHEQHLRQL
jgi:hypothetical protein